MKTVSNGKTVNWKWDYAADEAVKESEMPEGSERWKASEKAKWGSITEVGGCEPTDKSNTSA
jgi:hypothetical protein